MSVHADAVAALAEGWIGTPYRHRASVAGVGCDCLGLVRGVWRGLFGAEPQIVPPYAANGRDRAGADALLRAAETYLIQRSGAPSIGDVVLFRLSRNRPPRHCGIMLDDETFVHAQEHIGVVVAPLSAAWRRRIAGVYQFPQKDGL